ncbi:acylneuraminate cytidylyltransferase family protein [Aquipseudomonas alcaligenes]|uniref:acylneuraminate cytidylyltransferase family protein n=1 Tax=Aquipseudomonas alcaligenes TaxID=43263 RepID=UPI0035AF3FB6
MYLDKTVLGLITARGGSKGLPRKNVLSVGGKPLIGWTVEAAKQSSLLDRIVLSSDDEEIIHVAKALGCEVPFRRDAALSGDAASSADVIIDCLQRLSGYDYVVLLQPTSPLRTAEDIDAAIRQCIDSGAPACVSLSEAQESPFWMYSLEDGRAIRPIMGGHYSRRQDLPPVYVLNGAVYVAQTRWFLLYRNFISLDTHGYIMPLERSLDIDTAADLELLEEIFRRKLSLHKQC